VISHTMYHPLLVAKRWEIRGCEEVNPKSPGCRMLGAIIISSAGGPAGPVFVRQISRRGGPMRELALGRYGDCSLSTCF